MNILLVEDNQTIASGLEYAFSSEGYSYSGAVTLKEARQTLTDIIPDIIILDITLPDGNGLDFYEEFIAPLKVPTIFLTAMDEEETIVKSFLLGADDYVTKPFSTKELLARINRIVMRNQKQTVIRSGEIAFDMDKMICYSNGCPVALTSLELKILHLMFVNINKVVSRSTILDKIWEWTGNDVDDHTVTVYVKRIREKIGNNCIITVKGIGYRIDET